MSNYTQTTDFSAKDALTTGDPAKLIKGVDFDTEFAALETAIATKVDSAGTGLSKASTTLSLDHLGIEDLADPNDDRIFFWDDSAGMSAWLDIGTGLAISTTTISLSFLGIEALVDPNADRILFWDDSAGATAWLTVASPLTVTATTLDIDETLVDHDVLTNFVADEHVAHSGVTLTAGAGLTGGGTIAASRSFAVDFAGQTAIDIASIAEDDLFLMYDTSASGFKKLSVQNMGLRVKTAATQTLALDDNLALHRNSGASDFTVTVPPNSSVAFPIGAAMAFVNESTGKQTLAAGAGVTIVSLDSALDVIASGGMGILIKTATDTWALAGDLG